MSRIVGGEDLWSRGDVPAYVMRNAEGPAGLNYMIPFDIFLWQGHHVIFFSGFDDYGNFYVYESTTTNSWDRVMFHVVDATYVAGYEMRRYNDRC